MRNFTGSDLSVVTKSSIIDLPPEPFRGIVTEVRDGLYVRKKLVLPDDVGEHEPCILRADHFAICTDPRACMVGTVVRGYVATLVARKE